MPAWTDGQASALVPLHPRYFARPALLLLTEKIIGQATNKNEVAKEDEVRLSLSLALFIRGSYLHETLCIYFA